MTAFEATMDHVMISLITVMQVSIAVPMVVAWRRGRHFTPAVRLASWYVYLSALSSFGGSVLYPAWLSSNYGVLVGFNVGKILLFGTVYHLALTGPVARRLVLVGTVAAVAGVAAVVPYGMSLVVDVSRVVQCALLAAFALCYLNQRLDERSLTPFAHNPVWLLSVGQLLYSGITVGAFSFDYLSRTAADQTWKYIVVAIGSLSFNWFLTLALLRARRPGAVPRPQLAPATF